MLCGFLLICHPIQKNFQYNVKFEVKLIDFIEFCSTMHDLHYCFKAVFLNLCETAAL